MNRAVIFLLFTILSACQKQSTLPHNIPKAPVLLPTPADTLNIERGLDAVPERDAIQVDWMRGGDYEVYALYRRSAMDAKFYLQQKFNSSDSSYLDTNVMLNVRYDYYLVAQNESEYWSPPSDTVSYMLIEKASNLFFSVQDQTFHWHQQEIPPRQFVLKLFEDRTLDLIWLRKVTPLYQQSEQSLQYNDDGKAMKTELAPGTSYIWRIDSIGPTDHSGSESQWSQFTAQ
jgi:hypothetical protein